MSAVDETSCRVWAVWPSRVAPGVCWHAVCLAGRCPLISMFPWWWTMKTGWLSPMSSSTDVSRRNHLGRDHHVTWFFRSYFIGHLLSFWWRKWLLCIIAYYCNRFVLGGFVDLARYSCIEAIAISCNTKTLTHMRIKSRVVISFHCTSWGLAKYCLAQRLYVCM